MKNILTKLNSIHLAESGQTPGSKDHMSEIVKTLEHVISSKTKAINGLISRNGGRGLIGQLLSFVRSVRPKASKSVVRQVASFVFFIHKMNKQSGSKGVVIYLKACQVLLQQSVGQYRVINLDELKIRPKRNRAGVPLIIPAGVRVLISRDRDIPTIKLWMTLFGFYRIMEFRGKLNLSTITDPSTITPDFIVGWDKWLEESFKPLLLSKVKFPALRSPSIFPILKSGPTTEGTPHVSSSGYSLVLAARRWMKNPELLESLKKVSIGLGSPAIANRISIIQNAEVPGLNWKPGYLGKLGLKLEPAGKVRIFAMVDAWTQWLLSPLHSWIFQILKNLKEYDGTFNQIYPVDRLQRLFGSNPKRRTFSSIDLSAATDRLPISLQVSIIRCLLKDIVPDSSVFAEAWKHLLVGRPYRLNIPSQVRASMDIPSTLPQDVLYATGQPMGALSSWAMLALTHHGIVQYAAHKAGFKEWFQDYAILGDDVIIAHGQVAYQYRLILQSIGVKAGLAKSIIAKSVFVVEFAKKFFVDLTTANMVPIKECIAVHCSTSMVVEFVRKYKLSLNAILAFMGYGYKARMKASSSSYFKLGTRLRVLLVWLTHPSSPFARRDYYEWVTAHTLRSIHEGVPRSVLSEVAKLVDMYKTDRNRRISRYVMAYANSIDKQISTLNTSYPVSITSVGWSVSDAEMTTKPPVMIDWSNLIHGDLTGDSEVTVDEYGRVNRNIKDTTVDLGWDDEQRFLVEKAMNAAGKTMFIQATSKFSPTQSGMRSPLRAIIPSVRDRINEGLKVIFTPSPILNTIPETFWAENRKELTAFRDFLEIYKMWQELSRPIWANYYKNNPLEEPKKVVKKEKKPRFSYTTSPISFIAWVPDMLRIYFIGPFLRGLFGFMSFMLGIKILGSLDWDLPKMSFDDNPVTDLSKKFAFSFWYLFLAIFVMMIGFILFSEAEYISEAFAYEVNADIVRNLPINRFEPSNVVLPHPHHMILDSGCWCLVDTSNQVSSPMIAYGWGGEYAREADLLPW